MKNLVRALFALMLIVSIGMEANAQVGDRTRTVELHDPVETARILADAFEEGYESTIIEDLTPEELYSVAMHMDSTFELIYKPTNIRGTIAESIANGGLRAMNGFKSAGDQIEQQLDQSRETEFTRSEALPIFMIKTSDFALVSALKSNPAVEFIGPASIVRNTNFQSSRRSSLRTPVQNLFFDGLFGTNRNNVSNWFEQEYQGCGNDPAKYVNVKCTDDGALIPWNYEELGIDYANTISTGRGKKVALIDSGVSPDQGLLGAEFDSDYSGREIIKKGTFSNYFPFENSDGVDDGCGHGTHMAGTIASPNYPGGVRGVAYESDLLSIRAIDDVIINTAAEVEGVTQALGNIILGTNGYQDVDIISMSLGSLANKIASIELALSVLQLQGVLTFVAAGTSPDELLFNPIKQFVCYPGSSAFSVAVTGVYKDFPNTKKRCDRCHLGFAVDFVVPMQYGNASGSKDKAYDILTHSLSMGSLEPSQVGGSSIATATMAGIAALYWAAPGNENKTRKQVLDALKDHATYKEKPFAARYGHGEIDVKELLNASGKVDLGSCEKSPCEGVSCPEGQVCQNGTCVDENQNLECINGQCWPGYICVDGYCVPDPNTIDCSNGQPCPLDMKCIGGKCVYQ